MKDPLDNREDPYEFLGVSSEATTAQVARAYSEFIKDRSRLEEFKTALMAKDRLTRPSRRIEVDLLQYPSSEAAVRDLSERPRTQVSLPGELPKFELDLLALISAWPEVSGNFVASCGTIEEFSVATQFEDDFFRCLPINFPT